MQIRIKGGRAFVQAGMTPKLHAAISRLEGRKGFEKDKRTFTFAATGHNLVAFRDCFADVVIFDDDLASKNASDFDTGQSAVEYRPKRKDMDHQARCHVAMSGKDHFAIFMEQGTGKTKVAIDWAGKLWCAGKISGMIVVAPKGVHRQWVEAQFPSHFSLPFVGAFHPFKNKSTEGMMPGNSLRVFTINYDGLKTKAGRSFVLDFIKAHGGRVLMVLDESHNIKNKASQRWKACKEAGDLCSHRLLLTGTPIAKDLTDEWAQLAWLDESIIGIRYLTTFRNVYCIMGGFEGRVVVGTKNLDKFKALTAPFVFRARKEELGLLPKVYDQWYFDITPEQRRIIKQMQKEELARLSSGVQIDLEHAAVVAMKIQQVANGFIFDEDKKVHQLFDDPSKNPRLIAAREISEAYEGEKVIWWARFREDLRQLEGLFGPRAVSYHGGINDRDRAAALDAFKRDPQVPFFLSNPSAGGTGIDGLQEVCSLAVYYSNSDNPIDRWQSEDRIHRIGQSGGARYIDIVSRGTTDAKIIWRLRKRKAFSELVIDDVKWLFGEEDPDLSSIDDDINLADLHSTDHMF